MKATKKVDPTLEEKNFCEKSSEWIFRMDLYFLILTSNLLQE
ncbi:8747_t:CDS:1, partial [Funneliformis geosporum]